MQVIKMRFLAPSLILAVFVFVVLSPMASANPVPPGGRALDWQLLPAATLFNYLVNLGIVVAAFWLVKRAVNRASMKKLAIIVLLVTLVGMDIWVGFLAAQSYVGYVIYYYSLPAFILVSVVEVFTLAFLLRFGRLSTLGQGILIGAAMVVVGFFVGLSVIWQML